MAEPQTAWQTRRPAPPLARLAGLQASHVLIAHDADLPSFQGPEEVDARP